MPPSKTDEVKKPLYDVAPPELATLRDEIIAQSFTFDGRSHFDEKPVAVVTRSQPGTPWKDGGRTVHVKCENIQPRMQPLIDPTQWADTDAGKVCPVYQLTFNADSFFELAEATRQAVVAEALASAAFGKPDFVFHEPVLREYGENLPSVRDMKAALAQGVIPFGLTVEQEKERAEKAIEDEEAAESADDDD